MTIPETFRSEAHSYRVVRELSQGGQGKTLLVERQSEPGSTYVLKLLRIEHVDDWKQVELFEREVTTLAALDHPGIPRLVDRIVEHDRTSGIVQTVVPGQTIAEQMAERSPLSPDRFEQIVRQSLEILAYLHEQVPPVMHRDINPRNVMLDDRHTYLIDFGAVRVGGKTDMTSVGTFGYMAPEQIIGRPQPASDMYGLGMTLVCLAECREVGDLPVDASTGQVDRGRLLRGVEPPIRDVILGMCEPGLAERITAPREALRRLDAPPPAIAPSPAVQPAVPRGSLPVPVVAPVAARSTWVPVYVMAGVAIVVSIGIGLFVMMPVAEPPVPVTPMPPSMPVAAPNPPPAQPPTTQAPAPPAVPAPHPKPAPPKVVPVELTEENSAELTLSTTPTAATVTIDGAQACTTPCAARVAFGEHRVVLEADGKRVERTVVVLEDTELAVALTSP